MSQKIINFGIYLVVFSLPLYLVRFKITWIPFSFLEVMIYLLFLVWLISRPTLKSNYYYLPIFLIFLGVTISTWLSSDLLTSAGIWKGWFIAPLLFFALVINSIKTKEQVKNILIALSLSGIGVAIIALYYWLNNNLTYDGRLRAFYLSPNHLAMYLSPILILSFYLFFNFRKKVFKTLWVFGCLLMTFIIYLTYSFGAWLGLLAAFVFILAIKKDKKMALILFLIIILTLVLQVPNSKFPAFKSRLIIWQSAAEIIKTTPNNFLWGVGPGMFQKYYLAYQEKFSPYPEWAVPQPHNLFLAFWLQTGLIGLIGFIWLLIQFFKKNRSLAPKLLLFIIAAMIYTLVHGLVDTPYFKNDLSVIFWLLIALGYKGNHLSY